jgi:hypothetical protein
MIKLRYSAVDGVNRLKSFRSLAGARNYAISMLGKYPSFGSYYAVSDDGVGKIEVISGVKLRDLFGEPGGNPDPVIDELEASYEEELRAEEARELAQIKAEAEMWDKAYRAYRIAGCSCSEQQLNLVGCDCAASRGESK